MNLVKIFVQESDKICRCEHIPLCNLYDRCMKETKNETTLPPDRRPNLGVCTVSRNRRC
jgi:hypothetical protein